MIKTIENKDYKEIDFTELSTKFIVLIRNYIKKFFKFLKTLLKIILKNFYLFLFTSFLGLVLGYTFYKILPYTYYSDLTIKTNGFTINEIEPNINYLEKLCKTKNYKLLSDYLQIDQKIASKIKNIKLFYYIDKNKDGIPDMVTDKKKITDDTT